MKQFETVTVETDLLILGGGMAACGAAVEAAYWAKKNGLKVSLVDKAAMDRSGAVAMGLSAINQYVGLKDGENTVQDYVDYVRNDLMGVTREDLVANIARHVDSSVHLFEKWGLPIWTDDSGGYVHEGRWQLMINGESYKVVIAEAAKNALGTDNIYERVFIVGPLMDGDKCLGAYGFSVREDKFYVFKAKATLVAMGGAVHVFKPRSSGEGQGRAWYPPWNAGASAYFTLAAGAEMTCQEVRFIPALQGRLRTCGRLVPALQVPRDQRRRRVHGERGGAREVGPTARSSRFPPTCVTGWACWTSWKARARST